MAIVLKEQEAFLENLAATEAPPMRSGRNADNIFNRLARNSYPFLCLENLAARADPPDAEGAQGRQRFQSAGIQHLSLLRRDCRTLANSMWY